MSTFEAFIKFSSNEDKGTYFASVAASSDGDPEVPKPRSVVTAYRSFDDLQKLVNSEERTIDKLLAPLPDSALPIYCVGLNYRSHAAEAQLSIPKYPPLWNKPSASLADPDEAIPINEYCATSLLDFEGELVFVTSKECKNVKASEADQYILGYTIGNDLSCRFFQMPGNSGGQFFYAKAFDRFAPIGPVLVSAKAFGPTFDGRRLRTKINGQVVQDVEISEDMIFTPQLVLSHMSQGTTIPAGTAVMTGTPAGVGVFQSPKSFLRDGDVVEVAIDGLGTLKNSIRFEK